MARCLRRCCAKTQPAWPAMQRRDHHRWPQQPSAQPALDHSRGPDTSSARGGAEQQRIAVRTLLFAAQHARQRRRIVGRILRRAARLIAETHAVISRIAPGFFHLAVAHIQQQERPQRRRFIPATGTVHHEGTLQRQAGQRLRHQSRSGFVECTDHMEWRLGRIGQRPQYIEHRTHAHRGANRTNGLHRGVIVRARTGR